MNLPWTTGVLVSLAVVFGAAAVAPFLRRALPRGAEYLLVLAPLAALASIVAASGPVVAGEPRMASWEWAPSFGLALSFRLDGFSLLFAVLVTGIGALIVLYGGIYLRGHRDAGRFDCLLLFFMGSMLGLVLADNLIALFIFWELTSIASYFLIGFNHRDAAARASALRALLITAGGGLALLAALVMLGVIGGTLERTALVAERAAIVADPLYPAIVLLVLIGAFTKSAQVPFHFWLPDAMKAPTPASAYLHSATMVKAGVILLAKLAPVLGSTPLWHHLVTSAGAVTMATGALLALFQTDLKRLLAYSTVSALGTLVLLLGIGTNLAIKAMLVFLVVHALYKAALFMVAGAIDKSTGTRQVPELEGLYRTMPFVAVAAALAAFSMSGLPPLIGFIGKELLYEAKIQAPTTGLPILVLGIVANAANVAVALKVGISPFVPRRRRPATRGGSAVGFPLGIAPLVLALLGLLLGIFPGAFGNTVLSAAIEAITTTSADVDLKLWHGVNPVFLLSVGTVILGVVLFLRRNRSWEIGRRIERHPERHLNTIFDRALGGTLSGALAATRFMQNGRLTHYVRVVVLTLALLGGLALAHAGVQRTFPMLTPVSLPQAGAVIAIILAALHATASRSRFSAIIALGTVGYGVAVLFALNGAPDLAITQLLVETLTVVLFAIILRKLPRIGTFLPVRARLLNGAIAAAAGVVITLFVLKAVLVPVHEPVSTAMAAASYEEAHGRNVVNVILVDFRALDTLGEIVVLAVAALGVRALLYRPSRRGRTRPVEPAA